MTAANFFNLDFVGWWKAASILLTAFFAVLGLVTEFKDQPTKRITKWGKLALIGILVSTGFGIYSQLLETAGQNEKRAEDTRQALQLLWGNQQTLNGIERSLSLLDEPTVWAVFSLSCVGEVRPPKLASAEEQRDLAEKMRRFCKATEPFNGPFVDWPEQVWRLWPYGSQAMISFAVLISRQSQAQALESELDAGPVVLTFLGTPKTADWYMMFDAARAPRLLGSHKGRALILPGDAKRPNRNVNNGKLQSFVDLNDAYLYIAVIGGSSNFRPDVISLEFRNGRSLSLEAKDFELLGDKAQYFRAKIKIEH